MFSLSEVKRFVLFSFKLAELTLSGKLDRFLQAISSGKF